MNEEIKAASVDSREFHELAMAYRAASFSRAHAAYKELLAHINAWGSQLAASRAMLPVTDSRLTDEQVHEKFVVWAAFNLELDLSLSPAGKGGMTRNCIEGARYWNDDTEIAYRAFKAACALATPVAGWVSVEDERKPKTGEQILMFFRTLMRGEDNEGNYREQEGTEIAMGEYRTLDGGDSYFDCYTTPFSDSDRLTHWMPLPPAPVTPKQEQS